MFRLLSTIRCYLLPSTCFDPAPISTCHATVIQEMIRFARPSAAGIALVVDIQGNDQVEPISRQILVALMR